jgi:hypothetical protein
MKWISVTERLPDDDRDVLVTVKTAKETFVSMDSYMTLPAINFTGWIDSSKSEQIIAWAELPEPYGGE